MKKRSKPVTISRKRWNNYLIASAAGAIASLAPTAALEADHCTDAAAGVLLGDQSIGDGLFTDFGPYTFGAAGASFVFQQAFSETGTNLGILIINGYGNISFVGNSFGVGSSFYPTNMNYSARLDSANFGIQAGERGALAWGGSTFASEFNDPGVSYVGFRFDVGQGTQYGWIQLDMFGSPDNRAIFQRYGWYDPNADNPTINFLRTPNCVFPTSVPEPGALCLLALGSIGVMAWRSRRG